MTASTSLGSDLDQPVNAWVKRTPLATSPTSPRLGYEGACVWDTRHHLLLRYGGHNQGGGGEQGAEVWTYRYAQAKPGSAFNWPAPKARSQPRLAEDVVVSVLSPTRVEVTWKPPDDPTIVGYHVERATVEVLSEDQLQRLKRNTPPLAEPSVGAIQRIGPFSRLTTTPLKETRFSDTTIDLTKSQPGGDEPAYTRRFSSQELDTTGKPYRLAVFAYRVRAVNTAGLQSGPSPPCFTIPSSPQWLFSKETGQTCQLKWPANLEKGIRGYRVYRMDGRYDNEPVSRLSPEPITALTYQDPTASKSTRRYYVVAVDAMGQEGFPSSPVWFINREWRSFYAPFVSEWHQ